MTFSFNPTLGTILVGVRFTGPAGTEAAVLGLDTGASTTTLSLEALARAGYDPTQFPANVPVTTGSGIVQVPRLTVAALEALGHIRLGFPVLAYTLPPSAAVDGVLGLDFFRGHVLTIDFVNGRIALSPGPSGVSP